MIDALVRFLQRLFTGWFPPHHTLDPRLHHPQYTRHGMRIITSEEVDRALEERR